MSEQEREQEIVVGVLTGVVQKGESKWQALVRPDGSQYDKKLWTKSPEAHFWLSGHVGERVSLVCNASYWTNKSNQQIRSLWIDRVDVEGADVRAYVQQNRMDADPKNASIQRQCATKVAVQMLAYLDPQFRTMGKLVDLSNLLVGYYETGQGPSDTLRGDEEIPF